VTLEDALRKGRVELAKVTKRSRSLIDIGIQYTRNYLGQSIENNLSLFSKFDFMDFYKIGASLYGINKTKVKKAIAKTIFDKEDKEYFLGLWWSTFLENTFLQIPKTKTFGAGLHTVEVTSIESFNFWKSEAKTFCELLPFITSFHETLENLSAESKINDDFYLNYEVKNIDFESILLSSFINYSISTSDISTINKIGLTIPEFKIFLEQKFTVHNDEHILNGIDAFDISGFASKYGFKEVNNFSEYLYGIMMEHLNGYDFNSLAEEDFKHVGGPILLNIKTSH
jgi:hypothetical protein